MRAAAERSRELGDALGHDEDDRRKRALMLTTALIFLIETAAGIFTVALLLRFLLQWARAAQRNPGLGLRERAHQLRGAPARRIIPGLWGLDLATLVLAWLTQFVQLFLVLQSLQGYQLAPRRARRSRRIVLLAVVMVCGCCSTSSS